MQFDVSPAGIKSLVAAGESSTVEFKRRFSSGAILQHVTAFASSSGGIILFGIGEGGEIVGVPDNVVSWALRKIRDYLSKLNIPWQAGAVEVDSKKIVYLVVGSIHGFGYRMAGFRPGHTRTLRDFFIESILVMFLFFCLWYLAAYFQHSFFGTLFRLFPPFDLHVVMWTELMLLCFFALVFYGTAFEITPLRLLSSLLAPFKIKRSLIKEDRASIEKSEGFTAESNVTDVPRDGTGGGAADKAVGVLGEQPLKTEPISSGSEMGREDAGREDAEVDEVEGRLTDTLFLEVLQRASFFANRMQKRTDTYMFLGLGMGLFGLGFWYFNFRGVALQHYNTFAEFLQAAAPRATILFFIELFAGFFLRQYRIGVEDFRYFFELEQRAGWKRIAYSIF